MSLPFLGWSKGGFHVSQATKVEEVKGLSSHRAKARPLLLPFQLAFLLPTSLSLPDKRPTTSSSFTGFQPPPLARRDSSLKRLTRWGSQGNRTLSANSSEQKSLYGEDETPTLASTSQEDKLDPAPEN